jgi:HAD superfamily hydrolase (TIGR01549 family)
MQCKAVSSQPLSTNDYHPSATLLPMKPLDPQPELVLFDLDDTLCDYASARLLRLRIAFDKAFSRLPTRPDVDLDVLAGESIAIHPHGVEHFNDLLARYDVSEAEIVAVAQQWYQRNRFYGLNLFDGAQETLMAVRRAVPGRRLGMITNGPAETQTAKIDLLGLRPFFDFIIISGEFGTAKPDRLIFDEAMRLGEAEPEQSVYIGDSPEFDMAGARNAGILAVWMNTHARTWEPGLPPPDIEVSSLREVAALLRPG